MKIINYVKTHSLTASGRRIDAEVTANTKMASNGILFFIWVREIVNVEARGSGDYARLSPLAAVNM